MNSEIRAAYDEFLRTLQNTRFSRAEYIDALEEIREDVSSMLVAAQEDAEREAADIENALDDDDDDDDDDNDDEEEEEVVGADDEDEESIGGDEDDEA